MDLDGFGSLPRPAAVWALDWRAIRAIGSVYTTHAMSLTVADEVSPAECVDARLHQLQAAEGLSLRATETRALVDDKARGVAKAPGVSQCFWFGNHKILSLRNAERWQTRGNHLGKRT